MYPKITDNNFNTKIYDLYKDDYKIKISNKTFDNLCFPKKYTLQLPQQFVADFMNPSTPYMDLLVYHRIGSGKTCAAIQIAEKWKNKKRIIIVVPASLRGNFRNELRSNCVENVYITKKEKEELSKLKPSDKKYEDIIKKTDKRIDDVYEIYSYHKFVELVTSNSLNLKNALLIIDEIQNMISEEGNFYWTLHGVIKNAPKDLRLVLLSATPMFDKPSELALTLNLMRLPKPMPTGKEFNKVFIRTSKKQDGTIHYNVKNIDQFKAYIKGYISYYLGAPSFTFPKTNIKYVKCQMSDFQYGVYRSVSEYEETYENEMTNDFYLGSRMISNVVYPNKQLDEKGLKLFVNENLKKNLSKFSCKFAAIMEKIEKTHGKVFVYSNFKEYGGLASFIKVLEIFGYKSYFKHGVGKKTFAVWTGDETDAQKNEIRNVFNQPENIKGKNIKILLGSSSIKEGVTLLNVRQAHIIDGYWNWNKIKQIIGRVSRYCSHKELPEHQRSVNIYLYLAVEKNEKIETIDQYMNTLAHEKDKLIQKFEDAIKESAIDCKLNVIANSEEDNPIRCDK
jgi:superfamily II DNA or RNA helicase